MAAGPRTRSPARSPPPSACRPATRMRISLLLEREPFGEIVEETLPTLLGALSGRAHTVRWYGDGHVEPVRRPDEQIWLCNPLLNAIFLPQASAASLEPVVREFR